MTDEHELKALGESAERNDYPTSSSDPDASLLEAIQFDRQDVEVQLEAEQFTSLCPVTGQPDYGEVFIYYEPWSYIVESKSLKLYLMSYRNYGSFGETIAAQIRDDLVKTIRPRTLTVRCKFAARGDIGICAEAEYEAPDWPSVDTNEYRSPTDASEAT